MGELAREREVRDLRVSRGHIAAGVVGTVLLVCTAFGVGFALGHDEAPEAAVRPEDGELVELLARLEASGRRSTDELTYPDALAGRLGDVTVAPDAAGPDGLSQHIDGAASDALVGDTPPDGAYTVVVARVPSVEAGRGIRDGLRAAGKADAWLWVERIDGHPNVRVALGGAADEAAALALKDALEPAFAAGAEVVPLHPEAAPQPAEGSEGSEGAGGPGTR